MISFPRVRTVVENTPVAWGWAAGLYVFLIGLILWLAGCQQGVVVTQPHALVLADQQAETVRVDRYCGTVDEGTGSGLAISTHDVMTVGHVMLCHDGKTMPTATVTFASGHSYKMTVTNALLAKGIVRDEDPDGWVRLSTEDSKPFEDPITLPVIAMPKTDEHVCQTTGWPARAVDCGIISDVNTAKPTFAVTISVRPGNSGSPVWDSNGKLVGFTIDCKADSAGICRPTNGDAINSFGVLLL